METHFFKISFVCVPFDEIVELNFLGLCQLVKLAATSPYFTIGERRIIVLIKKSHLAIQILMWVLSQ
jgi:hypothetical protein